MELPGEVFHFKMAPIERLKELKENAYKINTAKKAGVMVLFYPAENLETRLILILRKTYKGVHSAQIGFPGGRFEIGDELLQGTALRETEEEIGIPREAITVLKKLTEIYIPPSDYFVQPYLGITANTPRFQAQEAEVEALLEVPISIFMDDKILITTKLTTSYATEIEVPAFFVNGHVVWGATAMILSEVREMLKQLL